MNNEIEKSKRSWFNIPNIIITIALLIILILMIWNQSISEVLVTKADQVGELTITPTVSIGQLTPVSSEFHSDPTNTRGIISAGVLILLIVFASGFWKLRTTK